MKLRKSENWKMVQLQIDKLELKRKAGMRNLNITKMQNAKMQKCENATRIRKCETAKT